MFSLQDQKKIISKSGVNIGLEVFLEGQLIYGSAIKDFENLKTFLDQLSILALSDIVAINLTKLDRWDSLGVAQTLRPIIQINQQLLARGRKPIALIGDKRKDVYLAVKDKYPDLQNSSVLVWYDTLDQFLAEIELF